MLILATVVIELTTVYGWSYAELIALGTPSFIAFGVFSLPAGWLGDRWSRRNMMALFYLGCGASLAGAALAPSPAVLAVALSALGMFAAIYHPVGTAMLIEQATSRGRSLAFNGVSAWHWRRVRPRSWSMGLAGAAPSWCRPWSALRPALPICCSFPTIATRQRAVPRPPRSCFRPG
jgi:MFS family permease